MFYGLMAGVDMKLSKICRACRPTITMKKAGYRLCMHLDDEGIEKTLHSFIARKVTRRIKSDTLIIVDPSDIYKSLTPCRWTSCQRFGMTAKAP